MLDAKHISTWIELIKLEHDQQKNWVKTNFKDLIGVLQKLDSKDLEPWNILGYTCIDNNLYTHAERIYDELLKKAQKEHGDIGLSAYLRGITHFLQGRFQDALTDFKISRQHDLHIKKVNGPSSRALAYMEETLFPTREIIKRNQAKLIKAINSPRNIDQVIGPNMLRTIHKWNSSSPLYSQGISQGGGYFLSLVNAQGKTIGIAIDPGYDFLNIFRDLGLTIADLDVIIMTHDHDDHTEAVEGILSLLAKYNDYNEQRKSKILDVFGSAGTLLKFQGLLSATDPYGNREINFKLLVPGSNVTEIEGQSLKEKYGFTLTVVPAFHKEMWTNQESSVGLVIHTNIPKKSNGGYLNIGVTGDSRYEPGLGKYYKDVQVILFNIGSVEKEEGKLLGQHLGMLGCINLLKEARLGKPLLAILTEFGEEFSGKRDIISKIIKNWAQPMAGANSKQFRVIPADMHLEIRLEDLNIRESDTNVFLPYTMIQVDETDEEVLKYRFTE